MLSPGIKFKPFKNKKKVKKIKDILDKLLIKQNQVLGSLGTSYKYSYDKCNPFTFSSCSFIHIPIIHILISLINAIRKS